MSNWCPFGGKTNDSGIDSSDIIEKESDSSWWCFASGCRGKQSDTTNTNDVALNTDSANTNNGLYIRRPTIQFQLDQNVSENTGKKSLYKTQSSILKSKVGKKFTQKFLQIMDATQ